MIRNCLLQSFSYNVGRVCMSTYTESAEFQKKLDHYKNLHELETSVDAKPQGWDEAKPFDQIPGPKPLPIIGNVWRFALPKIGEFYGKDFLDVHRSFYKKYGEISILNGLLPHPIVILFNPKDIETLARNEGVWPVRRNLPSLELYHHSRKDVFDNFGLIVYHREKWFKTRTVVNPILMQPKNILQYTDKMNLVADELVDNIEYLSKQNKDGEMPKDFRNELHKWALESIGVVTLDTHLGCLKRNLSPDSEPSQIVHSAIKVFDLMGELDLKPSLYKYISTPNWKEFVSNIDFVLKTNIKHINRALDELEKQEIDPENETKSVLQQLLKKDRKVAVSMATDMMLAGIDTTGRVLGAALYYMAKNPEKQKILRDEAKTLLVNKDSPVTKEVLAKANYLKAVIKEVTRFAPIAIGNVRTTVKDLVLGGYQIPKGTDVSTSNLLLSMMDQNFPRAREFLPERWLPSAPAEISHKNANPFIFLPFGFGPRSCIGKRVANLELEVALLKIVRNFELDWRHEDMEFATTLLYGMVQPLKIHVKSVEQ